MNTFKNTLRLSMTAAMACVSLAGLNSASAAEPASGSQRPVISVLPQPPQQCHQHTSCCYKTVTRWKWIKKPYRVQVTRYQSCGAPYLVWVTRYKSVKVAYQVRIKVCNQ